MPVPGSRDQFRDHTVRNPDRENMRFFESVPYHGIAEQGQTPGTMERTLRGCIQAVGQLRYLWRQTINFTDGQEPYSWTRNEPQPGSPVLPGRAVGITRALRYMTRSVYIWGGSDNSRFAELHTPIVNKVDYRYVSLGAGQKRYAPTVRNRLTSFGSRVPPINRRVQGAEEA